MGRLQKSGQVRKPARLCLTDNALGEKGLSKATSISYLFGNAYTFMKNLVLTLLSVLAINCVKAVSISGKITNEKGQALEWATVSLENTHLGTVTDKQGHFSIKNVPPGEYMLAVTFVGYQKHTQKIVCKTLDVNLDITISKDFSEISEVMVSADIYAKEVREQSIVAERVDKIFLEQNYAGSLMQTLKKLPGVSSIETGSSVSKPVIRGMSFNRIAVVNNGLKLEGQQWGETHGLEIDQYTIENLNVIKGPASLMHGSDAVGGVIQILPPVLLPENTLKGEIKLIGKSGNHLIGSTAMLNHRKEKYFYRLRITHLNYGDIKVPAQSTEYNTYNLILNGKLKNTAGRETGVKTTFGKVLKKGRTSFELSNLYRNTGFYADAFEVEFRSSPIDHDASNRDVNIPNQKVNHFRFSNQTILNFSENKLKINIGYQNNVHTDYDHLQDKTGKAEEIPHDHIHSRLKLSTFSGNIQLNRRINKSTVTVGNQTQYVLNSRSGFNFVIPDYRQFISGIFIYDKHMLGNNTFLNIGLRYDYAQKVVYGYINPRPENSEDSVLAKHGNEDFQSFTGMAGVSLGITDNLQIKFNLGKSFRIPSIRETHSHGKIFSAMRYEVGNPDLTPEEAYQADLMLKFVNKDLTAMIAGFYSYFTNYIYANPSGEWAKTTGDGQIYNYTETEASRSGGEFQVDYWFQKLAAISCSGEYVYAVNHKNNAPLPFTPPISVDASAKVFLFKKSGKLKNSNIMSGIKFIDRQTRFVQNEIPNLRGEGKGTPGAYMVYIGAFTNINLEKIFFQVSLKVDNLFNSKYYNHLSIYRRMNLPEAGRNIQLSVTVPFKNHNIN